MFQNPNFQKQPSQFQPLDDSRTFNRNSIKKQKQVYKKKNSDKRFSDEQQQFFDFDETIFENMSNSEFVNLCQKELLFQQQQNLEEFKKEKQRRKRILSNEKLKSQLYSNIDLEDFTQSILNGNQQQNTSRNNQTTKSSLNKINDSHSKQLSSETIISINKNLQGKKIQDKNDQEKEILKIKHIDKNLFRKHNSFSQSGNNNNVSQQNSQYFSQKNTQQIKQNEPIYNSVQVSPINSQINQKKVKEQKSNLYLKDIDTISLKSQKINKDQTDKKITSQNQNWQQQKQENQNIFKINFNSVNTSPYSRHNNEFKKNQQQQLNLQNFISGPTKQELKKPVENKQSTVKKVVENFSYEQKILMKKQQELQESYKLQQQQIQQQQKQQNESSQQEEQEIGDNQDKSYYKHGLPKNQSNNNYNDLYYGQSFGKNQELRNFIQNDNNSQNKVQNQDQKLIQNEQQNKREYSNYQQQTNFQKLLFQDQNY
ncbi:hypothetical protein PPERSA_09751 [Pseudocohnilembus persalinus]|uniref:Uncharacterized protein n=1 Tax=Pseudocohnilembus persalinus TaxID=266149 RepID=A0A0V0QTT9_PSEPJ|nr:hypothetical protein PPERSA_09751 [Pseudocohnilembus persalinus]|eukprot:KRX05611.1 hypothetical protein PPERSA_09751 [Pseudocohnilembus persalinus]